MAYIELPEFGKTKILKMIIIPDSSVISFRVEFTYQPD